MSWQAVQHVIRHSRATSAPLQCVLLVIAEAAGKDGAASIRSYAAIAKAAKLSTRQAIRAVAKLQRLGALVVESRGDWNRSGLKRCNQYRVVMVASAEPVDSDADVTSDAGVTSDVDDRGVVSPVSPPSDVGVTTRMTPVSHVPSKTIHHHPVSPKVRATRSARVFALKPETAPEEPTDSSPLTGDVVDARRADDLRLLQVYGDFWRSKHRAEPQIDWPRDRKLIQRLLKTHPADVIEAALVAYFGCSEAFIMNSGHTLTLFRGQFNKFLAAANRPAAHVGLSPNAQASLAGLSAFVARHEATAGGGRR